MKANNNIAQILAFFILFLLSLQNCFALPEVKRFHQYVQNRWSVEDGLIQVYASNMVQDSQGYIWIGSQVGLSRFDGVKFTNYRSTKYPQLSGYINKLFNDSQGRLWIGSSKGLILKNKNDFQFVIKSHDTNKLTNSTVYVFDIVELANKDILFSSSSGVFKVKSTSPLLFENTDFQFDKSATYGMLNDKGSLWLGKSGAIIQHKNGHKKTYSLGKNKQSVRVEHIIAYQDSILAGTTDGLYQLIGEQLIKFKKHPILTQVPIESLMVDSKNELWVGTNLGLFHILNDDVFEYIENNNPSALKVIISMIEDHEGNLWFGSYVSGIARLSRGSTYQYGLESNLSDPLVWSVAKRNDDSYWVGTNSGLNKFENEKYSLEISSSQLPHPVIYTLFATDKELFMGTRAGLAIYSHHKVTTPAVFDPMKQSHIRSIISDGKAGYYFGTNHGLFHFTNNQLKHYQKSNNGNNLFVTYIFKTSDNRLLLGSEQGLYQFNENENEIKKLYPQTKEQNIEVTYIYENDDKSLLLGTSSGGLVYNKGEHWQLFNQVNGGLPTPGGFFIAKDFNHNIWVSSFNGLYRFPFTNIERFINGKISSLETEHILSDTGSSFGAEQSDCCIGSGTAKGIMSGKVLILPSRTGLIMLNTEDINHNKIAPQSIIERIHYSNQWKKVNALHHYQLDKHERDIIFEFTALSFQNAKNIKIKYKLEGYDKQWKQLVDVSKRQVSYTNLPAGDYQFLVKGSNNSNVWSANSATLNFSISPYYYETFWFYLITFGFITLWLVFWYKKRMLFYKNQKIALELEVKKRTKELSLANKKLTNISYTDPLTGLKNRRFLHEQIIKDIAYFNRLQKKPDNAKAILVLMMVDIDHFKSINDTYGHDIGDKVIAKFSKVLLAQLREDDYIVRWGGEEFLIVSRATEQEQHHNLAIRLCQKIEQTNFGEAFEINLKITCSIGFALFPFFENNAHENLTWEDVVNVADKALYQVKNNGRNGWATYKSVKEHSQYLLKECDDFEAFIKKNKLKKLSSWLQH